MNTGRLRHRLALQVETQSQGATGEVASSYATDTTVWGALSPVSGREMEQARQISEEITYKAVIRYYSSLTTEYRILYDSRVFEIANIQNFNERNIYQILLLKEVK
ncbi:MAG: hypothetical protein B6244_14135 [Candidatus Cloacimonetes bacterium 4572_55]|nr:MAG: hypothetical protein B6244_14135 [Candidatus Cloacimonetes bacterium 4572_55]